MLLHGALSIVLDVATASATSANMKSSLHASCIASMTANCRSSEMRAQHSSITSAARLLDFACLVRKWSIALETHCVCLTSFDRLTVLYSEERKLLVKKSEIKEKGIISKYKIHFFKTIHLKQKKKEKQELREKHTLKTTHEERHELSTEVALAVLLSVLFDQS